MDAPISAEDLDAVNRVLQIHQEAGLQFHKLQTRLAGARKQRSLLTWSHF